MITVEHVTKYYEAGTKKTYALQDVSFTLQEGEFVVVLGQSGAGKSTLLNLLGGIDCVSEGSIVVNEVALHEQKEQELAKYRANEVGFIFQFYNLLPTLTVLENVALMKELKEDSLDPLEVLTRVGLRAYVKKFPSQLSGGEQQRVSIARAIVKNPELLLCDEPTGALDSETGCMVLELLQDICKEYHKTVILVTHNASIAQIADRVIHMRNGRISNISIHAQPKSIKEVEW